MSAGSKCFLDALLSGPEGTVYRIATLWLVIAVGGDYSAINYQILPFLLAFTGKTAKKSPPTAITSQNFAKSVLCQPQTAVKAFQEAYYSHSSPRLELVIKTAYFQPLLKTHMFLLFAFS